MKFDRAELDLDPIDLQILDLLQENCKRPLTAIGEKVGLTASSVMERIHKLENADVILGYTALLDARALGKAVSAFIGVSVRHPRAVAALQHAIDREEDVLECHHVTGEHTLMLKVKTESTETLEQLIDAIRSMEGVSRTETMVVLSTHTERVRLPLDALGATGAAAPRRGRRNGGGRPRRGAEGAD
jgi:Lrp/AsnC family leucine-responsive transcriptional regulator